MINVSFSQRREFAQMYCARTFVDDMGQTGIVCSYPRGQTKRVVCYYDMDGGEFHTIPLNRLLECFAAEPSRDSEAADFEWDAILSNESVQDDAADIKSILFDGREESDD